MNPALFRPGTSDKNIWKDVVECDEYRLPQMTENDLCIDVGANTGAATYAMLQKGAGKVISFEPDPENYLMFRKQLKQEIKDGRVEVYPLAVVGGSGFSWRMFSGVVQKDGEVNYGGAYLFTEDGKDTFGYAEYMVNSHPSVVPCIGFDDIMFPDMMNFRLLKLDCEGAEFKIIDRFWCTKEKRPAQMVGEYHPHKIWNLERLEESLNSSDFDYEIVPHPNSELGLFFATRR